MGKYSFPTQLDIGRIHGCLRKMRCVLGTDLPLIISIKVVPGHRRRRDVRFAVARQKNANELKKKAIFSWPTGMFVFVAARLNPIFSRLTTLTAAVIYTAKRLGAVSIFIAGCVSRGTQQITTSCFAIIAIAANELQAFARTKETNSPRLSLAGFP